jgi:UDP-N-acetylglucosamine 3-dehydrogenase
VLNVALIGAGMMGKNHARVLSNLSGVELMAIVDPDESKIDSISKTRIVKSINELDKLRIDYAVIAAPTSSHYVIASELIERNIPFLVEKPISYDSKTANLIANSADSKNLKCGVGHIERFNAASQEARIRLENGQLGKIYQITTVRQGPFPQRIADVGVTFDLASHDIDLTSWLLGSNYQRVFAEVRFETGRRTEDLINVTGSLESGVMINHQVNWLSPQKTRSINILGERGSLQIDTLNSNLIFHENGKTPVLQENLQHFSGVTEGQTIKYSFAKPEPLYTEHEKFRDFVLGVQNSFISLADGAQVVKVAEGVLQSASTNNSVIF